MDPKEKLVEPMTPTRRTTNQHTQKTTKQTDSMEMGDNNNKKTEDQITIHHRKSKTENKITPRSLTPYLGVSVEELGGLDVTLALHVSQTVLQTENLLIMLVQNLQHSKAQSTQQPVFVCEHCSAQILTAVHQ